MDSESIQYHKANIREAFERVRTLGTGKMSPALAIAIVEYGKACHAQGYEAGMARAFRDVACGE